MLSLHILVTNINKVKCTHLKQISNRIKLKLIANEQTDPLL